MEAKEKRNGREKGERRRERGVSEGRGVAFVAL
jgi:hypothetical protein